MSHQYLLDATYFVKLVLNNSHIGRIAAKRSVDQFSLNIMRLSKKLNLFLTLLPQIQVIPHGLHINDSHYEDSFQAKLLNP